MELNAVILHKFWRPKDTLPGIGLQYSISKKTRTAASLSSMHGVFAESSPRKLQVTQAHYLCHARVSNNMSKYRKHVGEVYTNSEPGLPVRKQAWRIEDFDGKLLLLLFR